MVLVAFSSCKKDDPEPEPTKLEITIKDELGNLVSGASVKLYASQTDWANKTNQVGSTLFTDATGIVTFSSLSAIKYYWFAEKDCKNNYNGGATTTNNLTSGVTNKVTPIITATGTLTFVNTSSNPYRVYINGTATYDMSGNTTQYNYYVGTGSYTIRVLQLSGYAVYPTDQIYTGSITCGQTLTTTFP